MGDLAQFNYEAWSEKVWALLQKQPIFSQVLKANDEEIGRPTKDIGDLRGDEPHDMWECGDSPQRYVKSLLDEWTLYGPQGE